MTRVEEVAPSLVVTFTPFVFQSTLCMWNKTTVGNLITLLSDREISSASRSVAHNLLKDLASSHKKLFKDVVPSLAAFVIFEAARVSSNRSRESKVAVEDILKTLARLDDLDLPGKQGKEFIEALKTFALEGQTEKQGRAATSVLLKLKRRNVHADDLVKVIAPCWLALIQGNCSISFI